jgi:hypothetical protein
MQESGVTSDKPETGRKLCDFEGRAESVGGRIRDENICAQNGIELQSTKSATEATLHCEINRG